MIHPPVAGSPGRVHIPRGGVALYIHFFLGSFGIPVIGYPGPKPGAETPARCPPIISRVIFRAPAGRVRGSESPRSIHVRSGSASPSSRGLGHRPFTAVTRVRISLGTPFFSKTYVRLYAQIRARQGVQPRAPSSFAIVAVAATLGYPPRSPSPFLSPLRSSP